MNKRIVALPTIALLAVSLLTACTIDEPAGDPTFSAPAFGGEMAEAPESIAAPSETAEVVESETPEPEPEPVVTEEPDPAEVAMSEFEALPIGVQNAADRAISYLDYSGFSREGLFDQLKYEGYSASEAEEAITFIEKWGLVDWMVEVEEKADSYMEYSAFSRQGLLDQLLFEGFTQKQAEHGVTHVGY